MASSVGWFGAVAATVALAVAGTVSSDEQTARAVYPALEVIAVYVLVPMSAASLVSGLVISLGGRWGLLEHYWVVTKLLINAVASGVLLLYLRTLKGLAGIARTAADIETVRSSSPVLHGGGALILLIAATGLSIYKPTGRTRYGWRKQRRARATSVPTD